jgi:hypothetical protein
VLVLVVVLAAPLELVLVLVLVLLLVLLRSLIDTGYRVFSPCSRSASGNTNVLRDDAFNIKRER